MLVKEAKVRVAKKGNLQEVPIKQSEGVGGGERTALNLYKGQRKPVQNDLDASKEVLSCRLSLPTFGDAKGNLGSRRKE